MKRAGYRALAAISAACLLPGSGKAAQFCVTNAQELGAALTAASLNEQPDVIRLTAGTFVLHNNVNGSYSDESSLVVEGGYGPGCVASAPGSRTVIDASGLTRSFGLLFEPASADLRIASLEIMGLQDRGQPGTSALVISAVGGTVEVEGNVFSGNGGHLGSALSIAMHDTTLTVRNNLFRDNTTRLAVVSVSSFFDEVFAGQCHVTNNTLVGNRAAAPGVDAGLRLVDCDITTVANNVLQGNDGTDLVLTTIGSKTSLGARVVHNAIESAALSTRPPEFLAGNLAADPSMLGANHAPVAGSPLVDAGTSAEPVDYGSKDLQGNARVGGAGIDIGALEFTGLFGDGFE